MSGVNQSAFMNLRSFVPPGPQYELYAWGYNGYFVALGTNNNTTYSSPVQVGTGADWYQISGSTFGSSAIKTDGSLWSWGANSFGQLGLGFAGYGTQVSSPVQVGALTTWAKSSSRGSHTLAIKTDGTLWAWGYNQYFGSLGIGDETNRSSPVQVGALTTWAQVTTAPNFSLAIKTDGTLWAWGRNSNGCLGLGNGTNYSSPVQVGALTNWSKVEATDDGCMAIKTDGTLWAWGRNFDGQLGLGDTSFRGSPVQVGALTTWAELGLGNYQSAAIKTDGTLWTWGKNNFGQLGRGNTTSYSSPVQVGVLTNWAQVAGGSYHFISSKTDGTLWSWGRNVQGNLGVGNTQTYFSPVQVGALTNWAQVSTDGFASWAITI